MLPMPHYGLIICFACSPDIIIMILSAHETAHTISCVIPAHMMSCDHNCDLLHSKRKAGLIVKQAQLAELETS